MELDYYLDLDDFMIFNKKYYKDHLFAFKNYIFIVGFVIAVLFQLDSETNHFKESTQSIVSLITKTNFIQSTSVAFLLIVILIMLYRRTTLKISKKSIMSNPDNIGNRKLIFAENNKIILIKDNLTREFDLNEITKIVEEKAYYYLHVDNRTAIIVPKRVEKSDEFIKIIAKKNVF